MIYIRGFCLPSRKSNLPACGILKPLAIAFLATVTLTLHLAYDDFNGGQVEEPGASNDNENNLAQLGM
jgi:hypothetical protein